MLVSRYTDRLSTTHWGGGKYSMNRKLGYTVGATNYCICTGAVTNFSSTPMLYDAVVAPHRVKAAGAVHDSLYRSGKACTCEEEGGKAVSRSQADMAWREIALYGAPHERANAAQAWAGWLGLRLAGWCYWNEYRRADK